MKGWLLFSFHFLLVALGYGQSEITVTELQDHMRFLTSEKNAGRFPGTAGERRVVKYILKDFKKNMVAKFKSGYTQSFHVRIRVAKDEEVVPDVKTNNVIAYIEGSHSTLKEEFIVVSAHYDHLGMGGPSSKAGDTVAIHYGADDNASGTALMLEIAEKIAEHRRELKRSIIFVAFGAEEQGLLGSKYFTENPPVDLSKIVLMVNMDMVGRLNDQQHLYMGGAGTFPNGVDYMKSLGKNSPLNLIVHAGGVGGSDHVSFYKKQLSVLGLHTGGHPEYHRPEDTIEKINFDGMQLVGNYIYQAIYSLASSEKEMYFIPQD